MRFTYENTERAIKKDGFEFTLIIALSELVGAVLDVAAEIRELRQLQLNRSSSEVDDDE